MAMREITESTVIKILDMHKNWRRGKTGPNSAPADLSYTDLRGMDFSGKDLRYVKLDYSNLGECNLSRANLQCASLKKANLGYANLNNSDLRWASLEGVNLFGATTVGALIPYVENKHSMNNAFLLHSDRDLMELLKEGIVNCVAGEFSLNATRKI